MWYQSVKKWLDLNNKNKECMITLKIDSDSPMQSKQIGETITVMHTFKYPGYTTLSNTRIIHEIMKIIGMANDTCTKMNSLMRHKSFTMQINTRVLYLVSSSPWVRVLNNKQRGWKKIRSYGDLVPEKDYAYIMDRNVFGKAIVKPSLIDTIKKRHMQSIGHKKRIIWRKNSTEMIAGKKSRGGNAPHICKT